MSHESQTIVLINLGEDATAEELNSAATQLCQELSNSSAERVEKLRNDAQVDGSKGDPLTLGALALAMGVAAVPEIIRILGNWLNRRNSSVVSVKIKLGNDEIEFSTAASSSPIELEKITDRFATLLKKHATAE